MNATRWTKQKVTPSLPLRRIGVAQIPNNDVILLRLVAETGESVAVTMTFIEFYKLCRQMEAVYNQVEDNLQ